MLPPTLGMVQSQPFELALSLVFVICGKKSTTRLTSAWFIHVWILVTQNGFEKILSSGVSCGPLYAGRLFEMPGRTSGCARAERSQARPRRSQKRELHGRNSRRCDQEWWR